MQKLANLLIALNDKISLKIARYIYSKVLEFSRTLHEDPFFVYVYNPRSRRGWTKGFDNKEDALIYAKRLHTAKIKAEVWEAIPE